MHEILFAKKHVQHTFGSCPGTCVHVSGQSCLEISLQQPWQQEAWEIIPFTEHQMKRLNHCSKYVVAFG